MKMPPDDQIDFAIEWLRCNEGKDGEASACFAVANWLVEEKHERMLRQEARAGGVSVARLRARITQR